MSQPDNADLLAILDVKPLSTGVYEGLSPANGWKRIYGGQVVAQALRAAAETVPNAGDAGDRRAPHSLHSYFLRPGDPAIPIRFEVELLRDGGSFTTRRVVVSQQQSTGTEVIFVMSASFHKAEPGLDHQAVMPDVPQPDQLPDEQHLLKLLPARFRHLLDSGWPIEMRLVEYDRFTSKGPKAPRQHVWMRARQPPPADRIVHECVLAFASDYSLLDTSLVTHGTLIGDPRIQAASLDHAMWFHRPAIADDWLLFAHESPSAQGARGFCRGQVFSRDGRLIASLAQEGLIRQRA
jgi:acyl-CoA thioesterase II